MIYELYMKRRSKSGRDLINRYLLNKGLLEKKPKCYGLVPPDAHYKGMIE
jgi:hypothetical protein